MDNLSLVLHAKQDIRLENRSIPEPKDDEVLIRINSVGICGSDVHVWQHGAIGPFVLKDPMVLGHEASGTVAKCGKRVRHLKPGDRVAIEPAVPCRYCHFCKEGRYNLCPEVIGCAAPPHHGNLCHYYAHAADFCHKLPDNVSMEEGALLEPLSVAVHACRRGRVTAGQRVMITGSGAIGLVNLVTAKAFGASQVLLTDINDKRLELAKSMGADFVLNTKGKLEAHLVKEVENMMGGMPDVTLECSGSEAATRLALSGTKSGGTVVMVGLGAPEITLPLVMATIREVDIRGIFRYLNCYPIALAMVASGKVDVKPLVSHRFQLQESLKAYEMAKQGEGIKIMIKCGDNDK